MKYSDLHFSYCVRWGDTDTKKYTTTPDQTLSPLGHRNYETNLVFAGMQKGGNVVEWCFRVI